MARGVPTVWAVPGDRGVLAESGDAPLVWADPMGSVRGPCIAPLYCSVPQAALRDSALYECLALVDTVRLGRARERSAAIGVLKQKLLGDG